MKKITFLSILLCISFSLTAQHQQVNNNWYFGKNAGVTFSNGSSPSVLSNGNTDKLWAPSTVSDNNGVLLFYTDGRKVWGKNNLEMPNSGNIVTAFKKETTTMQTIITPDINNPDLYYLFTHNADTGFRYNTIDMTGNGGNGNISPSPNHLFNTNGVTTLGYGNIDQFDAEGNFTSYYDATTKVIWIVLYHKTELLVFKIDQANGFNSTAVHAVPLANLTTNTNFTNVGLPKKVKISPDGSRIAIANEFFSTPGAPISNDAIVTDFDPSTGTIDTNNVTEIAVGGVRSIEFSPDSNRLYLQSRTTIFTLPGAKNNTAKKGNPQVISAVNLNSQSRAGKMVMAMTPHNLFALPNDNSGGLQLGSDDKIWLTNLYIDQANPSISTSYLGMIDNPNTTNLTMPNPADFKPQELLLTTGSVGIRQVLPQKVFKLEDCPIFPKEIRGSSGGGIYSNTIEVDSNNNILMLATSANPNNINVDGNIYTATTVLFKYSPDGCLLWTKDIPYARTYRMKIDSQNNIIVLSEVPTIKLYKFNTNGDTIWEYGTTSDWFVNFELDPSDDIYLLTEQTVSNTTTYAMRKISTSSGAMLNNFGTIFSASYPSTNFKPHIREIIIPNSNNHLFIEVPVPSNGYVQFNSIQIHYNIGLNSNKKILRYDLNTNSIIPNSYVDISSNVSSNIKNYTRITSNESNHLFAYLGDDQINTYDLNLNLLNQTTIPISTSPNTNAISLNFNTSSNELVVLENGGIHKLKDDGTYNLTSVMNNLATNNIQSFKEFVQSNSGTIFAYSDSWDGNEYYNELSKIDPNSGQHLERGIAIIKEVTKNEVIAEKTLNIYPNPFNNFIQLQSSKKTDIRAVVLVNLFGKTVLYQKVNAPNISIDTHTLKNGIYFVKIVFTDGSSKVQRIIKE